jgi:DNA-binding Lrp family transcriptional regulator
MIEIMHDYRLDRQDVRILEILQKDCRISKTQLAEKVNLSTSQCYRRLKQLEKSGIIERYVSVLNVEKAGFDISAMVMLSFSKTSPNARANVLALINTLDEIQECYSASGEYDFILRVNCTGMRAYSDLINRQLLSIDIIAMHSYILMECFKKSTELPIKANS